MQPQHNISLDISALIEIENRLNQEVLTHRTLISTVYREEIWRLRELESFKQWLSDYTPYGEQYRTVLHWVISDSIRDSIKQWVDASGWSDRAVLALDSVPENLLKDLVLGLPPNPSEAQIRESVDYSKPTNLVTFPSGKTPSQKTKKQGGYSKVEQELQELIQESRATNAELKQENDNLRQQLHVQKDTATKHASLHVQKDTVDNGSEKDLLIQQLRQQIKESEQARLDADQARLDSEQARQDMAAHLELILNKPQAEVIQEVADDFGVDDRRTIAKQAKYIEELEKTVERLQQQLKDRSSTSSENELLAARARIDYLEKSMEEMYDPSIVEAVKAYAPVGDIGVLQSELVSREETIARISANCEAWEQRVKELKADNNKLAIANKELEQKVISLNELIGVATIKPDPNKLPEVIMEAVSHCDRRGYRVMVTRSPSGFTVKVDGGTKTIADPEDVADLLYACLEQSLVSA